jgi:hypothetical protein
MGKIWRWTGAVRVVVESFHGTAWERDDRAW